MYIRIDWNLIDFDYVSASHLEVRNTHVFVFGSIVFRFSMKLNREEMEKIIMNVIKFMEKNKNNTNKKEFD